MKWNLGTMTLVTAFLLSALVPVQDTLAQQCCPDQSGLIGNVELTFMKYMQEGGVSDPDGDGANFDLECAPRFELGYMGPQGLGVRSRFWSYDAQTISSDGDALGVDTYYIDLEAFHNRTVCGKTWLEISAGLRYLDFRQDFEHGQDLLTNAFEGWGGTFGVEAKYPLWIGNLYARGRWSALLGDSLIETGFSTHNAHDTTSTLTELGLGVEVNRDLGNWGTGSMRLGGEWQTWSNMAIADNSFGGIGNDDVMEDAGFAGFVWRLELRR